MKKTLAALLLALLPVASFGYTLNQNGQDYAQNNCNVRKFGADNTGVAVSDTAFSAALTACTAATVFVPNGTYKLTATLTLPANTTLQGQNKIATILSSNGNNDMLVMQDGSALYQMTLQGNAGTGRGIVINTAQGNQTVQNARIINFDPGTGAGVVDFTATDAGSRSNFIDVEAWNTNGASGSGKYAFRIPDAVQAAAVPRKFHSIETAGKAAFSFGGCNDLFITESFIADLAYTTNSRSVHIESTRIANQAALTINGGNHTLIGDDVNPQITLAAGLTNSVIGPISENNAPIIDNSPGNNSVQVFEYRQLYTPTVSNSGANFVLGNGTVAGYYTRIGSATTAWFNFTVGSTTTMGTTELRFTLPVSKQDGEVLTGGSCDAQIGAQHFTFVPQIPGNVAYTRFFWSRNDNTNSGVVTGTSPATFAAADLIRCQFSYEP